MPMALPKQPTQYSDSNPHDDGKETTTIVSVSLWNTADDGHDDEYDDNDDDQSQQQRSQRDNEGRKNGSDSPIPTSESSSITTDTSSATTTSTPSINQSTTVTTSSRMDMITMTTRRTCFHCGQIGHMAVHCQRRLNHYERSQQGKLAFEFFVTSMAHATTTSNNDAAAAADDYRIKAREECRQKSRPLHHFHKLRLWISLQRQRQELKINAHTYDDDNDDIGMVDPICLARSESTRLNSSHVD